MSAKTCHFYKLFVNNSKFYYQQQRDHKTTMAANHYVTHQKKVFQNCHKFLEAFQNAKLYESTFARELYQSMLLDSVHMGREIDRVPGDIFF